MQLPELPGTVVRKGYENWHDVYSISDGVSLAYDPTGGGGTGKPIFSEFSLMFMPTLSASRIWLACTQGRHLKQVNVSLTQTGGDLHEIVRFMMKDALITSYQLSGSTGGDSAPMVSLSLAFSAICYVAWSLDAKGVWSAVPTYYDIKTGMGGVGKGPLV